MGIMPAQNMSQLTYMINEGKNHLNALYSWIGHNVIKLTENSAILKMTSEAPNISLFMPNL